MEDKSADGLRVLVSPPYHPPPIVCIFFVCIWEIQEGEEWQNKIKLHKTRGFFFFLNKPPPPTPLHAL